MNGQTIRKQREALGLTIEQLLEQMRRTAEADGQVLELERSLVLKWERGEKKPATAFVGLLRQTFERLRLEALEAIPLCRSCGQERVEITREQVPADVWEKGVGPMWDSMEAAGQRPEQIVVCQHCSEYSVLTGWQ